MLRLFCCNCKRTLGFVECEQTGDSGDICPQCLRREYPDAYEHMKAQGVLTPKQIREAESIIILTG